MHWSQFIGGDVVISPPFKWQERYNASGIPVADRMADPVDPQILAALEGKFEEFHRAYDEKGLAVEQFDSWGPTRRTLRQFCKATEDMAALVRDTLVPNPDL
jgi:transaldolase